MRMWQSLAWLQNWGRLGAVTAASHERIPHVCTGSAKGEELDLSLRLKYPLYFICRLENNP